MNIVMVNIADLNPAHYNPRKISDAMMQELVKGIKEFNIVQPIVANRRNQRVIGGHQRLKGCIELGWHEVPTVYVDLDEDKEKALNLALNKISGEWDQDMLAQLLMEMDSGALDLSGFDNQEIDELIAAFEARQFEPQSDEDDVPEVEQLIVARPGDIFQLGRHRVICGDSTNIEVLCRLMDDDLADMVFTDPPYNVDYQGRAGKIKNDKMSPAQFREFITNAMSAVSFFMKGGAPIYVAHADTERISFQEAMVKAGIKIAACLIWKKNQLVIGRSDYQWIHEPILYGWKKGAAHKWYGDRKQTTVAQLLGEAACEQIDDTTLNIYIGDRVIEIKGENLSASEWTTTMEEVAKPLRNKEHPTMKPVALIERYVRQSSRPADIVADSFGGSGSTLITCEKTGRTCRTCELDEKFVDVIVRRWQNYTGNQAVREDDVLFDDIKPRPAG